MPQKTLSPKKLTLSEIYQVYLLIGDSVSNPIHEKLAHEMIHIFHNSNERQIAKVLKIFFGDMFVSNLTSGDVAVYMTKGIRFCNFLDFVSVVRKL